MESAKNGMNIELEIPIDDSYISFLDKLKKKYNVDFYNTRFTNLLTTNLRIDKGKMKSAHLFQNFGFSILVYKNGAKGFAISNDISKENLENKFNEALKLAKFGSEQIEEPFKIKELDPIKKKVITPQKKNLLDVDIEEKVNFLLEEDKKAQNYDKRIINTISNYIDGINHSLTITSDDRIIEKFSSRARIMIFAYSKEGNIYQSARSSTGISGGFEIADLGKDLGIKAAKRAIEILSAKSVKGGKYNIIIDPLLAGTFIHEAFGHACEADSVLANESILAGKIGKKLGPSFINVVDDPTIESQYGSFKYDSEGVEAKKTFLIKEGVLNSFMHSRETSTKMNVESTGNARAQNFTYIPQVRMSSTYIQKGDWKLEEMLEEMKNGLLCENWNYGYTEPNIGHFMFKMERAWLIENGEKKQLLRDAALSGLILDVLSKIRAISSDLNFDEGKCGKGGQYVPVNNGGPYVFVKDIVIGGL
ncbi:MAG: TldD/PmbA family protein [Promethearchaeota archaeon]